MRTALEGELVTIRRPRLSDAESITRHIDDKDVVRWTLNIPYPYPDDCAKKFIRKCQREWRLGKSYAFAIIPHDVEECVGLVHLFKLSVEHRNAEIGYWLGKDFWRKGYMSEAVKLILDFGFNDASLHMIYAGIFPENKGSKGVLEKNGFNVSGSMRQKLCKFGEWHDELFFDILASEYRKQKP